MGETFTDIVDLVICDHYYEINKNINSKTKVLLSLELFGSSLISNNLSNSDVYIIEIIANRVSLIFGLSNDDALAMIYNFFKDKRYKLNYNLIMLFKELNGTFTIL